MLLILKLLKTMVIWVICQMKKWFNAEDTLTILTKHIESMEISGDKEKLENLVRSLYTEALDTTFMIKFKAVTMEKFTFHW